MRANLDRRSKTNPGAWITSPWILARDFRHQGRNEEALAVLKGVVARKQRALGHIAPVIWQEVVLDLARAYQP